MNFRIWMSSLIRFIMLEEIKRKKFCSWKMINWSLMPYIFEPGLNKKLCQQSPRSEPMKIPGPKCPRTRLGADDNARSEVVKDLVAAEISVLRCENIRG